MKMGIFLISGVLCLFLRSCQPAIQDNSEISFDDIPELGVLHDSWGSAGGFYPLLL